MRFDPAKGPDGRMWISITVLLGVASFTFGIPADQAIDFVKDFSENVRLVQAECKRIGGGLVVAATLPHGPPDTPTNGHQRSS